jgi:hypothetical protein
MPMGASYGKGQSGLINFKKAAIYLK